MCVYARFIIQMRFNGTISVQCFIFLLPSLRTERRKPRHEAAKRPFKYKSNKKLFILFDNKILCFACSLISMFVQFTVLSFLSSHVVRTASRYFLSSTLDVFRPQRNFQANRKIFNSTSLRIRVVSSEFVLRMSQQYGELRGRRFYFRLCDTTKIKDDAMNNSEPLDKQTSRRRAEENQLLNINM